MRQSLLLAPLLALPLAATPPATHANGDLVVTEIMYDPASAEPAWEWIEVFNAGPEPVDLSGYFIDRVGDPARGSNPTPNVRPVINVGGVAVLNPTRVTAGRTAVLYNGAAFDYDASRFRSAWPLLPAAVSLVGVDGWSSNALSNTPSAPSITPTPPGLTFGFWPTEAAYRADTSNLGTAADPDERVVSTSNAAYTFAYSDEAGWPTTADGSSIAYSGSGSVSVGTSWGPSAIGAAEAYESQATFLPDGQLNGADAGSPGMLPPGGLPAPTESGPALMFSEVMYNPDSTSGSREWEWIEVVNHGASTIDFAATPLWFDDDDGGPLNGPNLVAGSIAPGEAAVLFDAAAATPSDMQTAWDQTPPSKLLPVTAWPTLANTGDTIGVWDSSISYSLDKINGAVANALVSLTYDDSAPWPTDNGTDSIYLRNLTFDPANGAAWSRATGGSTADPNAYQAAAAPDPLGRPDNSGADVGSPGLYAAAAPPLAGDYNNDGRVDLADYTTWRDGRPLNNETVTPHLADEADYLAWRDAIVLGTSRTAAPEPGLLPLSTVAVCLGTCLRWNSRG
ncbi:MAG: lamin tail domain-containing protein [Planctomycetota bacterium]